MIRVEVTHERFEIAGGFTISRGSRTHADVVVVTLTDGTHVGRGECVPYPRYGESIDSVMEAIRQTTATLDGRLDRQTLAAQLKAGAARNAIDCALWDLEAKRSGRRAADLAGVGPLRPLITCFTLSVGTPDAMAEAARKAADRPLLKVKLAGPGDAERIAAVRANAPRSRLVVDANEAWTEDCYAENMAACAAAQVELIEQPLPAGKDAALEILPRPVPVCADESLHVRGDLPAMRQRYDAVNIKLDKAGGLTEALALYSDARGLGFKVMVGCMLGTSLGMAPAVLVAQQADYVDLDGPLLLSQDRAGGLVFEGSTLIPPDSSLWG
ncbi:N-acetyl-D-Glu racemase DgcA [Pannonibacter sp. SL95]|uniref:N-acetyl-D-Glu racemase DgcA n=1 Tax=Pannonibacter sp. SL95 TaxID=2995153 RepID=UPI002275591A|nr:N-acetyl-D-Glu racemase DgcA [Pannonibacter sp. SL95]MCY1705685.1 dipeptide epimerase [Pannonibacter sp. SL95]